MNIEMLIMKYFMLLLMALSLAACSDASFTQVDPRGKGGAGEAAAAGDGDGDGPPSPSIPGDSDGDDPDEQVGIPGGGQWPGGGSGPGSGMDPGNGSNPGSGSGPGNGENPFDPVDPDNPTPTEEAASENKGCQMFGNTNGNTTGERRNYLFNGLAGSLMLAHKDRVLINGFVKHVGINSANHVTMNGLYGDICIIAKQVGLLNGAFISASDGNVLVAGEAEDSRVRAINGVASSTIVVIDMDVDIINGGFKKLIVDGGHVERINGFYGEIILLNGGTIGNFNGIIKNP